MQLMLEACVSGTATIDDISTSSKNIVLTDTFGKG